MNRVGTIFKAYDIRGVYGEELTREGAYEISLAFGRMQKGRTRACIGRDSRGSGPELSDAVSNGLLDSGCDVTRVGLVPIPVLGFFAWKHGYDYGIYASASHNPPDYNGIRFRGSDGAGFVYPRRELREAYLEGVPAHTGKEEEAGGGSNVTTLRLSAQTHLFAHSTRTTARVLSRANRRGRNDAYEVPALLSEYWDYVCGKVKLGRKLKLVLDPGNGAAGCMMPMYEKMGCEIYPLNTFPDGTFPGRGPTPSDKNLGAVADYVKRVGADFSVSFDPDADRGIVMDDLGRFVSPEKIAILIAKDAGRGRVVAALDCSMAMEKTLAPLGIEVIRDRIGDLYISVSVKEHDATIGVERSGHFFLPEFQSSDDPFAMSAKLAEIVSNSDKPLSAMIDEIPDYPYHYESLRCPDAVKFDVIEKLAKRVVAEEGDVDTRDGMKVTTDRGTVLIRASNTEPIIRIYVEGVDDASLKFLIKKYEEMLKEAIA